MAKGNPCGGGCGRFTKSTTGKCAECRGVRAGRPIGAKTERVKVEVIPPTCSVCGSTKRSAYENIRRKSISGQLSDGRVYRQIVWRDCKCVTCGQLRTEKSFELSSEG